MGANYEELNTPDLSKEALMGNKKEDEPLPKHRIRKQEIADHLGIPVDQLEIVD